MQASLDMFAILGVILYVADAWIWLHTPQKESWKHFGYQLSIAAIFLIPEIVLCILRRENTKDYKQVMSYILQSLALLLCLMLEAKCYWRLNRREETFRLFEVRSSWGFPRVKNEHYVPWTILLVYVLVLSLGFAAFGIIFYSIDHNKPYASILPRTLLLVATVASRSFLVCLSLHCLLSDATTSEPYFALLCVLYLDLSFLAVSVLCLLCPDMTSFLLAQTITSFVSRIPLFVLRVHKKYHNLFPFILKWFRKRDSLEFQA